MHVVGPGIEISAVIPTRGDVDMTQILAKLGDYPEVKEVLVMVGDTPFNRYLGARKAKYEVIYTQDDDCITDLRPLINNYRPGLIVNAMTPQHAKNYPGRQTLIGFGAIFDKGLVHVLDGWEQDDLFLREADRVFASLNEHFTVFPEIDILPCASAPNRLWCQPDHIAKRIAIEERIRAAHATKALHPDLDRPAA